jgi:hypothetical protein
MDDFPSPGTIHTLHTLLAELENMDDIDQWELYVSRKSRHFIHHGSRSMSQDSRLLGLFEQIDRARSNIQSSECRDYPLQSQLKPIIVELELESRYWMFVQTHPNHVIIPQDADHDVEEALLWCYAGESSTFQHESTLLTLSRSQAI